MRDTYFNYKEFTKYIDNIKVTKDDFNLWLKQFLLQQAQRVVRDAKLRTPVDTGFLRMSYNIGNEAKLLKADENGKYTDAGVSYDSAFAQEASIDDITVKNGTLQVEISNSAEYASYVEYGHHNYAGRYMLTIAVTTVSMAMPERFKKQFQQFLKERGVEG